jgi:hypothetical protein
MGFMYPGMIFREVCRVYEVYRVMYPGMIFREVYEVYEVYEVDKNDFYDSKYTKTAILRGYFQFCSYGK